MRPDSGFTMIELMVVLVVVVLLFAGGVARWPAAFHLFPAADQVARDLRLAQAMAMNRAAPVTWRRTGVGAYAIQDSAGASVYGFQVEGVTLGGATAVSFDSRGVPGSATSVTLNAEGRSVTVAVEAGTGAVRVL